MEYLKKYWYVWAGLVVLLIVAARSRSGGGGSLVQVGGGQEGLAYAQLDTQTALAETAQRYDFISGLLNYSLETDRIARGDEIERLRIAAGERASIAAAQYGASSQQSALNSANYQANLQYQAALEALNNQRSVANQQTWLQAIFGGFDRIGPLVFGGGSGGSLGGGYGGFGGGTPGIFPSGSWNWGW